jgi:hypothetical protein
MVLGDDLQSTSSRFRDLPTHFRVASGPPPKQRKERRSDGIPLFIEEITKAVLEAESEGAAERAVAAIPSPSVAVPASLHASLMARLDRLGPAKEVAQIGAAIGRERPMSAARFRELAADIWIGRGRPSPTGPGRRFNRCDWILIIQTR